MYIFIYNYLIIDNLCVVHARLFWSVQCKYNIHFLHVLLLRRSFAKGPSSLFVGFPGCYMRIYIYTYIAL